VATQVFLEGYYTALVDRLFRGKPVGNSSLTDRSEIEIDVHFVAFWRNDIHGDGVRWKLGSGEGQCDGRADERAARFGAVVNWLAGGILLREGARIRRDADVKIPPEIRGTRCKTRSGTRVGWSGEKRTIGIGQVNVHGNGDGFGVRVMIAFRLLCAVAASLVSGEGNDLSIGSEEANRRDVRAVLWRGKGFSVLGKEIGHRLIVTLAEKIGFADGGV